MWELGRATFLDVRRKRIPVTESEIGNPRSAHLLVITSPIANCFGDPTWKRKSASGGHSVGKKGTSRAQVKLILEIPSMRNIPVALKNVSRQNKDVPKSRRQPMSWTGSADGGYFMERDVMKLSENVAPFVDKG